MTLILNSLCENTTIKRAYFIQVGHFLGIWVKGMLAWLTSSDLCADRVALDYGSEYVMVGHTTYWSWLT